MRRIGGGCQSLKKFLMLMDHKPPISEKNFRNISNIFNQKIEEVEKTLMQEACKEMRGSLDSEFVDTGVTRQKRGCMSI